MYLFLINCFQKQMLQAAKTDIFHPLVHDARNSAKIYYFLYKLPPRH